MRSRLAMAALALSLAVGACGRDAATGPETAAPTQPRTPELKPQRGNLLKDLPFGTTALTTPAGAASGQTTSGTVTVTHFSYDEVNKTLRVDGTITYVNPNDGTSVTQAFQNVDAKLISQGSPTAPVCSILDLDIGAIHLNLLGLVVDLAPIHLDITAQSGPGNLLGNLLCAVANLLNQQSPIAAAITNLLDRINAILAGL